MTGLPEGSPRPRLAVVVVPESVDPLGLRSALSELCELVWVGEEPAEEAEVGGDTEGHGVGKGGVQPAEGLGAVGPMGDHLGEHRVVRGADHLAGRDAAVHPHPGVAVRSRLRPGEEPTGRGQEPPAGVLRVDPRLDGVAFHPHLVLAETEELSGCYP